MLWIKDCGAHFNHFRIVKRRIEEDQINNGGNGMTPSAIVTDEIGSIDLILRRFGLERAHWIPILGAGSLDSNHNVDRIGRMNYKDSWSGIRLPGT